MGLVWRRGEVLWNLADNGENRVVFLKKCSKIEYGVNRVLLVELRFLIN